MTAARMTGRIECRYHGRDFTEGEMALLRRLIAGPPALNRHGLSKEFCRRTGWFKPDGGLKDMMARVTMLAMHGDGLIVLPPPQGKQNRPGPIVFGQDTEPPLFPPPATLDEVRPLEIRTVVGGTRQGRLWNEFVARHHYLGYKTLVGTQMRYAVHDRNGWPLAMLGFSTAAWALAPRDRFIGWTPALRRKNLPMGHRQPPLPHPALDPHPQSRIPHPRPRPPPPAPRLDPPLQHHTRPRRDLRRSPPASPAASTGPPAGSASEPPRGVGDTTPPGSTASPPRMSGSAPSPSTGSASSTAEQPHPSPRSAQHIPRLDRTVTIIFTPDVMAGECW